MSAVRSIDQTLNYIDNFDDFKQQNSQKCLVLGMGNPLLDISCSVDAAFMNKYEIKSNNAILAEDKHLPMYEELAAMPDVQYIGGGATLNSMRVCQWMLHKIPNATAYFGCIGKDKFGEKLSQCAKKDGVRVHFMVHKKVPTGTCAVCILDKERSMVANLAAANEFKISHLEDYVSKKFLDEAKVVYSAGFFVTVSPDTMLSVAKLCKKQNKPYCVNFSAEFIVKFFKDALAPVFELSTHVFSNEDEVKAFAEANSLQFKDMKGLALQISNLKCDRPEGRTMIVTQGKNPVIVASKGTVREYPVKVLSKEEIVDLNGAGDAFVGAFLSQLCIGKDEKTCVEAGNYAARYIIQTSGTQFAGKPQF